MKSKIVLALDPSGNYNEGKGTTGWCLARNGYIYAAGQVYAAEHPDQMAYWEAVLKLITKTNKELDSDTELIVVCEDYRLYASASQAQINSNLETPQLIGVIKWACHKLNIPIVMQMAAEVKNRWSNEILIDQNIISKDYNSPGYHCGTIALSNHSLDALRHCVHYNTFKVKTRSNPRIQKMYTHEYDNYRR